MNLLSIKAYENEIVRIEKTHHKVIQDCAEDRLKLQEAMLVCSESKKTAYRRFVKKANKCDEGKKTNHNFVQCACFLNLCYCYCQIVSVDATNILSQLSVVNAVDLFLGACIVFVKWTVRVP